MSVKKKIRPHICTELGRTSETLLSGTLEEVSMNFTPSFGSWNTCFQHHPLLTFIWTIWLAYFCFPGCKLILWLPKWQSGKESACQCRRFTRDSGSIPGSGRSPGGGHGNPLQYSCLENPTSRVAWQVTVHSVAERGIELSDWALTHTYSLMF